MNRFRRRQPPSFPRTRRCRRVAAPLWNRCADSHPGRSPTGPTGGRSGAMPPVLASWDTPCWLAVSRRSGRLAVRGSALGRTQVPQAPVPPRPVRPPESRARLSERTVPGARWQRTRPAAAGWRSPRLGNFRAVDGLCPWWVLRDHQARRCLNWRCALAAVDRANWGVARNTSGGNGGPGLGAGRRKSRVVRSSRRQDAGEKRPGKFDSERTETPSFRSDMGVDHRRGKQAQFNRTAKPSGLVR